MGVSSRFPDILKPSFRFSGASGVSLPVFSASTETDPGPAAFPALSQYMVFKTSTFVLAFTGGFVSDGDTSERVADGGRFRSPLNEKAKYFISGLRFSLTLPSSKSSQEYDYTIQKDHVNQCQMKTTFPKGIDHNLNGVCIDNPQSSYAELSTPDSSTISQNYSSDSLLNRMSGK
ncbi:unnamed protein product [Trichobilharzia regenti]|nr:unnamed protein product [Trichobilharzia regenti]